MSGITWKNLDRVALPPAHAEAIADLHRRSGGQPHWRHRKHAEALDLMRVSAASPVAKCLSLDLDDDLRATFHLDVPVAVHARGDVEIQSGAIVHIAYPAAALLSHEGMRPQVVVVEPRGVFHPNVLPMPPQHLCLGPALPPGIRAVELVRMAYRALAMQDFQLDERDPAGVLHLEAARYWQARVTSLPLTRRHILQPEVAP